MTKAAVTRLMVLTDISNTYYSYPDKTVHSTWTKKYIISIFQHPRSLIMTVGPLRNPPNPWDLTTSY